MENSPSFDLNLAINQWRESLGRLPGLKAQNLNELEVHLRDSIATLQTRNLSLEESFLLARHRLGPAEDLAAEFRKVNRTAIWLERALWMLVGVQLLSFVTGLARVTSSLALLIGGRFSMGPTALAFLTSAMYAVSFAAVTFVAWRLMRNPPLNARRNLARLLGHSSLTALVIVFAGVLMTVLGSVPTLLFVQWQGVATMQATMAAQVWSSVVSGAVPLVFVAVTFAWLAKRHLSSKEA